MSWMLVLGAIWVVTAVPLALLVGRCVRLADRRQTARPRSAPPVSLPDDRTAPAGAGSGPSLRDAVPGHPEEAA